MATASSIRAGSAYVEIGGDDSPLAKALDRALVRVRSFGASLLKVGLGLSGLGTAALGGLLGLAKLAASTGDNLNNFAAQTGLTVTQVGALAQIAENAGLAFEDVATGIRNLQRNVVELRSSANATTDTFRRLGLSADDFVGRSTFEQFILIGDAIAGLEDPALRAATAQEVLGKSGAGLLRVFTEVGSIRRAAAEFDRLGLSIGANAASSVAAFDDLFDDTIRQLGALKNVVGAAAADTFGPLVRAFQPVLTAAIRFANENRGLVSSLAAAASAAVFAGSAITIAGGAIFLASFNAAQFRGLAAALVAPIRLIGASALVATAPVLRLAASIGGIGVAGASGVASLAGGLVTASIAAVRFAATVPILSSAAGVFSRVSGAVTTTASTVARLGVTTVNTFAAIVAAAARGTAAVAQFGVALSIAATANAGRLFAATAAIVSSSATLIASSALIAASSLASFAARLAALGVTAVIFGLFQVNATLGRIALSATAATLSLIRLATASVAAGSAAVISGLRSASSAVLAFGASAVRATASIVAMSVASTIAAVQSIPRLAASMAALAATGVFVFLRSFSLGLAQAFVASVGAAIAVARLAVSVAALATVRVIGSLGTVASSIATIGASAIAAIPGIVGFLASFAGAAIATIAPIIATIATTIFALAPVLTTAAIAGGALFLVLRNFDTIRSIFGRVVDAVRAVGSAVGSILSPITSAIGDFFGFIASQARQLFAGVFSTIGGEITRGVRSATAAATPFVQGALSALAQTGRTAFAQLADIGTTAWAIIREGGASIGQTAIQAYNSVVARMQSGDMQGAWNVAVTAMKLAWQQLKLTAITAFGEIIPKVLTFGTTLASGLLQVWENIWGGLVSSFITARASIQRLWATMVVSLRAASLEAQGGIVEALAQAREFVGDQSGASTLRGVANAAAQAARRRIANDFANEIQSINESEGGELAKLATVTQERIRALESARDELLKRVNTQSQDAVKGTREEIAKLESELRRLGRGTGLGGLVDVLAPGIGGLFNRLQTQAQQAAQRPQNPEQILRLTVRGAFGGNASAETLGTGGVQQQIATNTKNTAAQAQATAKAAGRTNDLLTRVLAFS